MINKITNSDNSNKEQKGYLKKLFFMVERLYIKFMSSKQPKDEQKPAVVLNAKSKRTVESVVEKPNTSATSNTKIPIPPLPIKREDSRVIEEKKELLRTESKVEENDSMMMNPFWKNDRMQKEEGNPSHLRV